MQLDDRPVNTHAAEGPHGVYAGLKAAGVNFAVSLPESTLFHIDRRLREDPEVEFLVPTREDEGIAMAVGAYLGGKVPVALMEGSGIGYAALILARAQIQRTPLLVIAGHSRLLGEPFYYHAATRLVGEGVFQGLGIPHMVVTDRSQTAHIVEQTIITMMGQKTVTGLFFPPYVVSERADT